MEVAAATVCTRALRLIRVLGGDESPAPGDLGTAFEGLASMLDGWAGDPGMVPDLASEFTMPGFTDVNDSVTIPEGSYGLLRMMTFNLAVEIAPEFGVEVPGYVQGVADESVRNWKTRVRALHAGRITHEPLLIRKRPYNILNG